MPQQLHHHTFPNGLTLLHERMDHVRSAAVNFLVPAGCVYDPPDRLGLVSMLSEMITRGAGDRDSRALTLAMDSLGLDHSESVGQLHLRFWGSTLARNIPPALALFADILRRPHLPADELDSVKALAMQDLDSLEDEPRAKVMVELRRRFWPMPLGQDRRGTAESIAALTIEDMRTFHQTRFTPRAIIISVAGNIEWAPLLEQVGTLFGDWTGEPPHIPEPIPPIAGNGHLDKDTTQTQIAIAYPSVVFGHPEYYAAMGAVQILSGGMGARLFTEVREKRGLCYSVGASYQTFKQAAGVLCYAGTTTERAQETLDVTVAELKRLIDGVTEEEVQRVRAGLKSSVIMQEESTSSRAGALASDWYYLGRVRPTEEIQQAIDALTPASILNHVKQYPPENLTIVTLGKNPLYLPGEPRPAADVTAEVTTVETTTLVELTPEVPEPAPTLPSATATSTTQLQSESRPRRAPASVRSKPRRVKPAAKRKPVRAAKPKPTRVKSAKAKVVKPKPKAKPVKAKAKAKRIKAKPIKARAAAKSIAKPKKAQLAKAKAKAKKAKPAKAKPGKTKPAKPKVKAAQRKTKLTKPKPKKAKAR